MGAGEQIGGDDIVRGLDAGIIRGADGERIYIASSLFEEDAGNARKRD
jgi:hypothetical protein